MYISTMPAESVQEAEIIVDRSNEAEQGVIVIWRRRKARPINSAPWRHHKLCEYLIFRIRLGYPARDIIYSQVSVHKTLFPLFNPVYSLQNPLRSLYYTYYPNPQHNTTPFLTLTKPSAYQTPLSPQPHHLHPHQPPLPSPNTPQPLT